MSTNRRHSLPQGGGPENGQSTPGKTQSSMSVSLKKDSLVLAGRASKSTSDPKGPRKLCEKCQKETRGNLKLPCGRVVKLCEACAMQFYDILLGRIMQDENPFAEYVKNHKPATTPQGIPSSPTKMNWTLPLNSRSGSGDSSGSSNSAAHSPLRTGMETQRPGTLPSPSDNQKNKVGPHLSMGMRKKANLSISRTSQGQTLKTQQGLQSPNGNMQSGQLGLQTPLPAYQPGLSTSPLGLSPSTALPLVSRPSSWMSGRRRQSLPGANIRTPTAGLGKEAAQTSGLNRLLVS